MFIAFVTGVLAMFIFVAGVCLGRYISNIEHNKTAPKSYTSYAPYAPSLHSHPYKILRYAYDKEKEEMVIKNVGEYECKAFNVIGRKSPQSNYVYSSCTLIPNELPSYEENDEDKIEGELL